MKRQSKPRLPPETIILCFLVGNELPQISGSLRTLCDQRMERCANIYKNIFIQRADLYRDGPIQKILINLRIIRIEQGRVQFINRLISEQIQTTGMYSLYHLLETLYSNNHNGYPRLPLLLQLINKTNPESSWTNTLIVLTLLSMLLALFFYLENAYVLQMIDWLQHTGLVFFDWIKRTFSATYNVNLLGIAYNALGWAWSFYKVINNTISVDRINAFLFKTIRSSLTSLGYLLAYFANGVFTGFAACLFVLSASMDVFESYYAFKIIKDNPKQAPILPKTNGLSNNQLEWQEYEESCSLYEQASYAFWVKVGAAGISTAVVSIWCFFPPSLFVTAFCMMFIPLVAKTKSSILARMHYQYANDLQNKIEQIYGQDNILPPTPQKSSSFFRIFEALTPNVERKISSRESSEEEVLPFPLPVVFPENKYPALELDALFSETITSLRP